MEHKEKEVVSYSVKDYQYNKQKSIKYIHTPKGDFFLGVTIMLHSFLNIAEELPSILRERMDIVFNPNRELISSDLGEGQLQIHKIIYE